MDMLKNFVFPVMEKEIAEFLQQNDAQPILGSYSDFWVERSIHFMQTSRLPDLTFLNRLTPIDPYMGRTAPLTSKRFILYIYSTNIGTEYFKHALYSPFFLFKMQFVS